MERKEKLMQLLKNDPSDSFLNHALALEYIKEGNDDEAENIFITLLEREPGYTGSYYHLGKLLERKKDYNTAMQWYEKGMALAKAVNDRKTFNELQAAHQEIADD